MTFLPSGRSVAHKTENDPFRCLSAPFEGGQSGSIPLLTFWQWPFWSVVSHPDPGGREPGQPRGRCLPQVSPAGPGAAPVLGKEPPSAGTREPREGIWDGQVRMLGVARPC